MKIIKSYNNLIKFQTSNGDIYIVREDHEYLDITIDELGKTMLIKPHVSNRIKIKSEK